MQAAEHRRRSQDGVTAAAARQRYAGDDTISHDGTGGRGDPVVRLGEGHHRRGSAVAAAAIDDADPGDFTIGDRGGGHGGRAGTRRRCQRDRRLVRRDFLAEMDRIVVRLRHPHDFNDVRAYEFVDIAGQAHIPEVFDEDAALDVVGM